MIEVKIIAMEEINDATQIQSTQIQWKTNNN